MIAPIIPYLSDEIYTKLTHEYSVHTSNFPKYDESLIDLKLEEKMDLVRNLISMGRMVREEVKIKVRTPLSEAIIDKNVYEKIEDLVPLIKEELNVKNILSEEDLTKYMNLSVKPNFKEVGKLFGAKLKDYQNFLETVDVSKLTAGEEVRFEDTLITKDMYEIKISSKEGFNIGVLDNLFIILNTNLTKDLELEGHAREFVSKIQNMRKTNGYEVSDRINIYYNGEFDEVVNMFNEYIKNETLALNIIKKEIDTNEISVNGIKVFVEIEKVI